MGDEKKAAASAPKVEVRSAFEWCAIKAAALNAKHENQWTNFLDVFCWVFNGWAKQDVGAPGSPWALTDAGRAITEEQFNAGVAKAMAVTFK